LSGRVCDGYGIWGGGSIHTHTSDYRPAYWRSSALRQYNPTACLVEHSDEDKATFEFFCKCPSLKISGMFKSEFWDRLLIQVSTVEPAVFHAVLAVGSAYRTKLVKFESQTSQDVKSEQPTLEGHRLLILRYYNKAIRQLNRLLERKDAGSLRFAAITCMLFICLEMVQRQHQSLQRHYQYGAVLLQEIQNQPAQPGDDHLLEAFTRISMHFELLNQSSPIPRVVSRMHAFVPGSSIPAVFNSVRSARLSLEKLLNSTIELRERTNKFNSETADAQASMMAQHAALQGGMSAWKDVYLSSVKTVFAGFSIMEMIGVRLLRNFHTMASIILGTCLSRRREICYDAFMSSFASIVSQFEDILKLIGWYEPQLGPLQICGKVEASFVVELGSIAPLFFVALKCRNSALRRRAIYLLQRSEHSEGMWSGPMLSRVAAEVVRLEEDGSPYRAPEVVVLGNKLGQGKSTTLANPSYSDMPVPEELRIHHVDIDLSWSETKQEVTLSCTRLKYGDCETPSPEITYHKVELM
jgi:hypothetical protein